MKAALIGGSSFLILWLAGSAFGHHASAGIDRENTATIEGIVTDFAWTNPHSWLTIEVENDQGGTDVHHLEMLPPSYLIRAGWTRSTVKPGDRVTAVIQPMLNGDPGGVFVSVTTADGEEYRMRGGRGGQ
jgi:hypothetical protein